MRNFFSRIHDVFKNTFIFEIILIQPKLNAISIYQNASKMLIFNENHKFKIFVETSTPVEYSTWSQNFFLNSKHTFENFHFLNRVHLNKIDKNIDASDPPKKPKKGWA